MDLRNGKETIASIPVEINVNPFTIGSSPPWPILLLLIGEPLQASFIHL
jgi:hypothetical protein